MPLVRTLLRSTAIAGLIAASATSLRAQVLFDNGPATQGGLSVLRTGGIAMGWQVSLGASAADDFSVSGAGWNVSSLNFFAYRPGVSAFAFNRVTWDMVSGDVNTGTVVASGTTDVTNGGLQGYRVTSSSLDNQHRTIFRLDADVTDFTLDPGNYWLRWSIEGSSQFTGTPFQPPTSDGTAGNAQFRFAGPSYSAAIDGGDGLGVEFPFIIRGTQITVPEPATWTMLLIGVATLAAAGRRRRSP